jgi:hypothetical protein
MRVNEITSLREELEVRPDPEGGFRVYDSGTNRPLGMVYTSQADATAAMNRLNTTPSARTSSSTSSDTSSSTTQGGSRGKPTDIERVHLKSERGISPVKYVLVQYDGTPINKTGSVQEFFDDCDKYDPETKRSIKQAAEKAKKDARAQLQSDRKSFIGKAYKAQLIVAILSAGAQVWDSFGMYSHSQSQDGIYRQNRGEALLNYIVPALGEMVSVLGVFAASHYVGRALMSGKLMITGTGSWLGRLIKRAARVKDKPTRWWQQFHPSRIRNLASDILSYLIGAGVGSIFADALARDIGLLREWAVWEFITKDLIDIVADIVDADSEELKQQLDLEEPNIEVTEEEKDAAIENVENDTVDEVIMSAEEAFEAGDSVWGND